MRVRFELEAVENARVRVAVEPVESEARIPIELDGETPGHVPAAFEIVPAARPVRLYWPLTAVTQAATAPPRYHLEPILNDRLTRLEITAA